MSQDAGLKLLNLNDLNGKLPEISRKQEWFRGHESSRILLRSEEAVLLNEVSA